jgi:hypothetical protein
MDKSVAGHASGWLVGRPRWAATFLERWLKVAGDDPQVTDLLFPFFGDPKLNNVSLDLHRAIGEFVEEATMLPAERGALDKDVDRRSSGGRFPGKIIADLLARSKADARRAALEGPFNKAVMQYACSGKVVTVEGEGGKDSISLVEQGLCLYGRLVDRANKVFLAEPLVVEAGVRRIGWAELVAVKMAAGRDSSGSSGAGFAFESSVVPLTQALFGGEVGLESAEWLPSELRKSIPEPLRGAWRMGRSKHGVYIKVVTGDGTAAKKEVLEYLSAVDSAGFDGEVEPMLNPDTSFGADHVAKLLRVGDLSTQCWSLWQEKLRAELQRSEIVGALCTIVPELIYHQKRGSEDQRELSEYEAAHRFMFGAKPRKAVFRILVDVRGPETRNEWSGPAEPGVWQPTHAGRRSGRQGNPPVMDMVVHLDKARVQGAVRASLEPPAAADYLTAIGAN